MEEPARLCGRFLSAWAIQERPRTTNNLYLTLSCRVCPARFVKDSMDTKKNNYSERGIRRRRNSYTRMITAVSVVPKSSSQLGSGSAPVGQVMSASKVAFSCLL
eukprot:g77441.t1